MNFEDVYLEHIRLHISVNDADDSLLKTLINSWFAHHKGAPFIDRKGKPLWLSNQSSKRVLANHLHAISTEARKALANNRLDELVIDHTIPSAALISGLKARQSNKPFASNQELAAYLRRRFTLALITKAEHNDALKPYKSQMTSSWCDIAFETNSSNRYCRYGPDAANLAFDIINPHKE